VDLYSAFCVRNLDALSVLIEGGEEGLKMAFKSGQSKINVLETSSLDVIGCLECYPGTGVVVYLERGADLHMAQLMLLPLTVSCFSKIQIGFAFLVPADPGSPGQRAVKRVCVCVCVLVVLLFPFVLLPDISFRLNEDFQCGRLTTLGR